MGIAKQPSCISLPSINKPYPTILDFLVQRFPKVGKETWQERIDEGKVLDDAGKPITFVTPYRPQKRLFYFREVTAEPSIPLQEKIIFQNDEILVADKPPFLPVTPSGPYVNECLLNRLKVTTCNDQLVPLHRIDRETSGLVLFSKNLGTRGRYAKLFMNDQIEKSYQALSRLSACPEQAEWLVENRLVKSDTWFLNRVGSGEINARSRIKLVDFKENCAHFQLTPITGKKHQLRIHMSGLGFPVMNDRYYPDLLEKQEDDLNQPLQLLAHRVRFIDPLSGQTMEFESEQRLLF